MSKSTPTLVHLASFISSLSATQLSEIAPSISDILNNPLFAGSSLSSNEAPALIAIQRDILSPQAFTTYLLAQLKASVPPTGAAPSPFFTALETAVVPQLSTVDPQDAIAVLCDLVTSGLPPTTVDPAFTAVAAMAGMNPDGIASAQGLFDQLSAAGPISQEQAGDIVAILGDSYTAAASGTAAAASATA